MNPKTLPLTLALAAAGVAFARPAHAIEDDRFTLRLGAMQVDAQSELRGSTVFAGQPFEFSEDFDFGGDEVVPRLEGQFRFSERNRLLFNYFGYDKDRRATLGQDLSFDDVTIPAGSFAKGKAKFQLASLMYDYAVVDDPRKPHLAHLFWKPHLFPRTVLQLRHQIQSEYRHSQ